MTRICFVFVTLIAASFFIACGDPAVGNAGNKAANVATGTKPGAPASSASGEGEIRKLLETAEVALGNNDADAMEKIYADNYTIVNVDGTVQNKAERLAALRSGDTKYTEFKYSEPDVQITPGGEQAIVTAKLTMKGTIKGKPMDGDYRVNQIYIKTTDGWKQMSAHSTKIDPNATKINANPDEQIKSEAKPGDKTKPSQKMKNDAAADDAPAVPSKKK